MTDLSGTQSADRNIILGRITRAHGVHGAVIIEPYGADPSLILSGRNLFLLSPDEREKRPLEALKGKSAAQGLIVKIKDISSRQQAETLRGWLVAVNREHLPQPEEDEVYLADLLGLTVLEASGRNLGQVAAFMEAGGGLLLVIRPEQEPQRELLIPYRPEFVLELDLQAGRLVLDPPPGLMEL